MIMRLWLCGEEYIFEELGNLAFGSKNHPVIILIYMCIWRGMVKERCSVAFSIVGGTMG